MDVVVEYAGDERENDMFNLLHEDKFSIGGVKVDIKMSVIQQIAKELHTTAAYLIDGEKVELDADSDIVAECAGAVKKSINGTDKVDSWIE